MDASETPQPADEDVTARGPARKTLAERIAAAMLDAERVAKSSMAGTGGGEKYAYASAEAILAAVRAPLLARGVLLLPRPVAFNEHAITSKGGTAGTRILIDVEFEFTDGRESIVRPWRGEGQDYGDKAYGKAYTNALKTFIRSAWLLPTEHDDPEGTPAGERASSARPGWTLPAPDEQTETMLDVLTRLVGGHRETAEELIGTVTNATGGDVPALFAGVIGALPQWREAGVARRAAEEEAALQDSDPPPASTDEGHEERILDAETAAAEPSDDERAALEAEKRAAAEAERTVNRP